MKEHVGYRKKCLGKEFLMNAHNIHFREELRKMLHFTYSKKHLIWSQDWFHQKKEKNMAGTKFTLLGATTHNYPFYTDELHVV